jgi:hypothetical protein
VIALLAIDFDMRIAQRPKGFKGKQIIWTFGFLEAENVRLVFRQKPLDNRQAQPN